MATVLPGTLVFLVVQEGRRAAEARAGERADVGTQQSTAMVREVMVANAA